MRGKSKTPRGIIRHPISKPGQGQIQDPNKELQIVGPTRSSSSFQLPDGWTVVGRARRLSDNSRGSGQVDKYYYEPGTGRQFRSLISVQRHLSGETSVSPTRRKLKSGNGKSMQIVPCIYKGCSSLNLPDGWLVEEKPRKNINYQGRIDRHYIEPDTGHRFRSLLSVHRYLTEGKAYATDKMNRRSGENQSLKTTVKWGADPEKKSTALEKLMQANHSEMQIVPFIFKGQSSFSLPDGWLVEEKPRKSNNYRTYIDRHYIEPGTRKRFRSLLSVKRYLTDEKGLTAMPRLLTQGDHLNRNKLAGDSRSPETVAKCKVDPEGKNVASKTMKRVNHSNNRGSHKEDSPVNALQTSNFDFASPPAKVKWVLNGPEGNTWSALLDDGLVPKYVRQSWSEAFALSINNQV